MWCHPHYDMTNQGINNGFTMREIMEALPREAADIDRYDVTLIVCLLNDVARDAVHGFSEASTIGNDLRELCGRLNQFRRPVLIVGGSSDLWGYAPGWDIMVEKMVLMARALGIPTIDGEHHFT